MPRTSTLLLTLVLTGSSVLGADRIARSQSIDLRPALISAIAIDGSIDPAGQLEELIASLLPLGSPFLVPGDVDMVGTPVDTVSRLRHALERLGYDATVDVLSASGQTSADAGVRLAIHVRARDRIRQIFVTGNWPLRQEEVLRRISLRPGGALPAPGPERDGRLERERQSVLAFLQSQGYREAAVKLELAETKSSPAEIHLTVRVKLGPAFPLGPVQVFGNQAMSADDIAEHLRHSEWRTLWLRPAPFSQSVLRKDVALTVQNYKELGYPAARLTVAPPTVDPVRKHVGLTISVRENKRLVIAFEGNSRFGDSTLADVLTFASHGAYNAYEIEASSRALVAFYRQRGQLLVKVKVRKEPLSPDTDRLVFVIHEGPVLKVRSVTIIGNRSVATDELAAHLRTKVFPTLGVIGLGEGGYTSQIQLGQDVELLTDFLREQGYQDATVRCEFGPTPTSLTPLPAPSPESGATAETAFVDEVAWRRTGEVHARFVIDEGPLVSTDAIRFSPLDTPAPYSDQFLFESLRLRRGAPFRPTLVKEDGAHLRRLLGDVGYPNATVDPQPVRVGNSMILTWQIKLGRRVRVGPVFIRGNFLTRPRTILQWIPMRPGNTYTTSAFERAQRNLALNQLFTNAAPLSFPDDGTPDGTVPMVINVEERHDHWGVLHVGAGASTEQVAPNSSLPLGIYGSVGHEHRNLFGLGWTFQSRAEVGNTLARATANFLEPRFLTSYFRLEVLGTYLRQSTARLGDLRSGSGSIGFARELAPRLDAALRYNVRNTYRTEPLLRDAGPDEDLQAVRIGTFAAGPTLSLEWLRLDNPLLPTRGFKIQGSIELVHPAFSGDIGRDAFVKTHVRSLSVVPIARSLGLRHSLRYDHGFPMDGASALPKVERFFAGGDTTIRGFELDRARAEIVRSPSASPGLGTVEYRPLGGTVRILHNIDIQFPVTGPWYGAVFLDSALLVDSFDGVNLRQFRHGVGVSPLLLRLPIGDISISWGWPLDPQAGDSRIGRLHFNVGLMF